MPETTFVIRVRSEGEEIFATPVLEKERRKHDPACPPRPPRSASPAGGIRVGDEGAGIELDHQNQVLTKLLDSPGKRRES